ncbi:ATP/GTP-binding protein [Streptomyces chiangmaiensis]|uniref:ATP/GTP-binding protein n=1 Tax=Streptomyces chiangmaiensis TaxID=766497 RepID=UPI0031F131FE
MLTRTGSTTAALAIVLLGPAGLAHASSDPTVAPPTDCGQITLCLGVGVGRSQAKPSGGSNEQHTAKPSSGQKQTCSTYFDGSEPFQLTDKGPGEYEVPCNDPELGSFSGGCYYKTADPQPPAGDPAWQGHKPGDGAIYRRSCPFGFTGNQTLAQGLVWMAQPPAAAAVDPAQLAQQAVDKMTLRGPEIGITPKPGGKGVVGMPVWMWTEKNAETWGPNTASASAGGVTVTATARVAKIVWKMGDGNSVTCTTAGTQYKAAYGKSSSPDCGYRYTEPSSTEPGGKFHVTATSTWTIDWQGGGQTGQLTEIRNSAVDITVAEVQVLN